MWRQNGFSRNNRQPRYQPRSGGRQFRPIKIFNPEGFVKSYVAPAEVETYTPVNSFSSFNVDSNLLKNIAAKGYASLTPIQDQAIPHVLSGRDVIGIANTGTGKTAAFLIPLIEKILKNRQEKILIVAPTRELATQIHSELMSFSRNLGIWAVVLIGGVNIVPQRRNLQRPFNFVIGTPGRIKDLIREKNLNLSGFKTVVLDEADRMVDMGFIEDIKLLIAQLPRDRQSLFFSATIDGKVREILNSFVRNPVTISVKTRETPLNVHQEIVRVTNPARKVDQLHDLLIQKEFSKVLIFGRTKWGVQKLTDDLLTRGFRADVIHGNKNQNQRLRALDKFKRQEIQILLATDVASRGLDIPNVTHVINYEMPESQDAYIHRIGRTGRADKKGVALTFV
ncbi:MAG: putative DEAD/DEAH box helicase domain protein [Microgenomates group bacterium Gr01-1014_16]|nr:MAG: putative DEAD/DEAH box helicase domain protein [Microgenomates group bacterium Gr01-1014_16]